MFVPFGLQWILWAALGPPPELPPPAVPVVPQAVADAVALSWSAPAACPQTDVVRAGIAELLGGVTEVAAAAEVQVTGEILEEAGSYRLALRVETPSGQTTKTMTAASCKALVDATALISAIAIDPSAVLKEAEPPVEPPAEPEPPPVEPPTDDTPDPEPGSSRGADFDPRPTAEPRLPSRVPLVRFAMQAFGGLDLTTLPAVSGGVGGSGAVFGAHWRAELGATVLFPRTGFAAPRAGAAVGLVVGSVRGCWVPTARSVELPLCGGMEAGALSGAPVGEAIAGPTDVREAYVGATLGPGIAWAPRPYFALVARTELVVPLLRPTFEIGGQSAHQVPSASGRVFAGIEARFP